MNTYCFALIFYQILSTHSLRKYIKISLENLYVDIMGLKRLTISLHVHVVVQFYPRFKFSFLLFLGMVMYDNNLMMSLKQKEEKIWTKDKIEPQHTDVNDTHL